MVRGHGNSFQKIYVIGWSTSIVHVQKHHQTDILDFWNAPSPPQLNTLIRGTKIKKISNFLYDSSFQPPLETIWRKRIGLITFLLICLFWVNLYQMLRHQDICIYQICDQNTEVLLCHWARWTRRTKIVWTISYD